MYEAIPQESATMSNEQARERLTDEQITQQVTEMQARLDRCSQTGKAYRLKWHEVKAIIQTMETLQQRLAEEKRWHGDHEEREAAVCPEDVPCDEYIRHLEAALSSRDTEIREVLEGLAPGMKHVRRRVKPRHRSMRRLAVQSQTRTPPEFPQTARVCQFRVERELMRIYQIKLLHASGIWLIFAASNWGERQ